jgi:hypothetical protein
MGSHMRCITKRIQNLLVGKIIRLFNSLKAFASRKRTDHCDHIDPCPGQTRFAEADAGIHRNAWKYLHRYFL